MIHSDLIVIGGGVIGLSIAYEAASLGRTVTLVDRQLAHTQASWAGAGIITPANSETALEPLEQLRALSNKLHAEWAERLKNDTGIDNEHTRCGCLYAARTSGELATLFGMETHWKTEKIEYKVMEPGEVLQLLGSQVSETAILETRRWAFLPNECRIRNSRHLKALAAACDLLGVQRIVTNQEPDFEVDGNRHKLSVDTKLYSSEQICLAGGAWTAEIASRLGIEISMTPVRGQIVLLHHDPPLLNTILYDGSLYLVPRSDGHLVAGSTLEEVGFDSSTTAEGIHHLFEFAKRWFPDLTKEHIVRTWAGLRPATNDGFPYLGKSPRHENVFIASGHFRSGLQLSTGTAKVMCQLMNGLQPEISLEQFNPARG